MTKRVIVTGASSGIGRQTALILAGHGMELVLIARRESALREVAAECRERGAAAADLIALDLRDADSSAAAISAGLTGAWSSLALVNVAGVAAFGSFPDMPLEVIEEQIEINLVVPIRLCHRILPHMLAAGGGQIVNVLSIAATHPFPGAEAYCSSKAGLLAFSRSLAAGHRRQGLRVSCVLPGSVDSPLWEGKEWSPPPGDMLSAQAVAETVAAIVMTPADRNLDEIIVMPPKSIL